MSNLEDQSLLQSKQPITDAIIYNSNKSMLVYNADWQGQRSFRLLPVTESCPFNEVLYDPQTSVLAVISKDKKEKPLMLPKMDKLGKPVMVKNAMGAPERFSEEREIMEAYYEYYIDDVEDIKTFIQMFAVNPLHPALNILTPSSN